MHIRWSIILMYKTNELIFKKKKFEDTITYNEEKEKNKN